MQYISLIIMTALYLLASVRYYPNDYGKTAVETLLHLISAAPLTIGCTLLIVFYFQKVLKSKLLWDRVIRIYLMLAILFEIVLGIQNYVGSG